MRRYYITDRKSAGSMAALLSIVERQLQSGVEMIQVREKDLAARELFALTLSVINIRARVQTPTVSKIFVNSRMDVAVAAGADGVHLPALAPDAVVPELLIGRSCHTLAEVAQARADFITFGPVFDGTGKGDGVGLPALAAAAAQGIAVYALGGVTWQNATQCIEAGATGIAGIRLFQSTGHT